MEQFKLLESLGLIEGKYIVKDNHLKRLQNSANIFGFQLELGEIEQSLFRLQSRHNKGSWKVRLLISQNGSFEAQADEIFPIQQPVCANIATAPVQSTNTFLYHKTTNREVYNNLKRNEPGVFDTLLWNERNEITEFTIGNIILELNGELYTPPIDSGLLNGTFREKLLDEGKINERIIYVRELKEASRIWLINSVRKWIEVKIVD